jgi:hypothetical protein
MGTQMIICTGSGKIGPRRILLGFRSSAFIQSVPSGCPWFAHDAPRMQKLHGEIYAAKPNAFVVRRRNMTGFHRRNSKRDDSFYHHADNLFSTCGATCWLTCWLTCGVTSGLGLVNVAAYCGQIKFPQTPASNPGAKA